MNKRLAVLSQAVIMSEHQGVELFEKKIFRSLIFLMANGKTVWYTVRVMTEKEKNKLIFEQMPVRKALANMALPVIVSQLIILVYNMADVYFLGRTNDPLKIAGASLILPIFNLSIAFANVAGTGGGTLISRLLGVEREDEARRVSGFSVLFSCVSSACFALLTAIFMKPLLYFLGASGDTFDYARDYATCVIVIGGVPTVLSMTLGNLIRNSGYSKQAGLGVSMGGILNIILDPLFMFVLLPKGNETLGAGIATALSNFVICLYFIIFIARMDSEILSFSMKNGLPEKQSIRSFFSVGIPAALGPLLFDIDYMVIDKLAASYSDTALAAIGIVLKVERFPLNIGVGLCLGMVPIAAYNFSAGNYGRVSDTVKCTRRTGIIIGIVSIILYEIFADYIIRFFISDAATIEIGSKFLRIRAMATVLMFMSFIYVHFFQSVGEGKTALFLIVLRWAVFNIPMLFILNRLIGMYGIVWAQVVSDAFVSAISFLVYYRFKKKMSI